MLNGASQGRSPTDLFLLLWTDLLWTDPVRMAADAEGGRCRVPTPHTSVRWLSNRCDPATRSPRWPPASSCRESTVFRAIRQDEIDRTELVGTSTAESADVRAAKRRITDLEAAGPR